MSKDYVLRQTTVPEKSFRSGVLIGNWYEERCDPKNNFHYFYLENKNTQNKYLDRTLHNEKFQKTPQNYLQYQPYNNEMYVTQQKLEFKEPQEQKRNSEMDKFKTKKPYYDSHQSELEEYRKSWTKQPSIVQRTYLGSSKK